MKILVIWRLLTVGGVNAGWRNRAISFKKHGIETKFLYTTDLGGMHIMQDVAPVYLTKNTTEIVSIIKNNAYDAIIIVDTGNAYKWLQEAGFTGPVIVESRTPELIKMKPHVVDLQGITPIVTVVPSHYQKRVLSVLSGNRPVEVIYNGVDTSTFHLMNDHEVDDQCPPFVSPKKKIIGWIGRLDKRKNWAMLLQIARLVQKERDDIEFWVIGGAQSVQREQFEVKWKEKGVTDIVKWYPVIPYQHMPQVYAKIRRSGGCTLATTKSESFGNTFIESMACGVPVVAPYVSSIPEIVAHGKTGRLYRENHVRGAVKQIYRIIDNPERYRKMSEAAVNLVQRKFDISVCAEQYVHLLKSVVKEVKQNDSASILQTPAAGQILCPPDIL